MQNSTKNTPLIKPHPKIKSFKCKQSKYEHVAAVPLRQVLLAPSGAGKTVLLSSLITDIYAKCFEAVYIWSPSINIDTTWLPIKEYLAKELKQIDDGKEKRYYLDSYHEADLQKVLDTQFKVAQYCKDNDYPQIFSILIVIDDMADNLRFVHNSNLVDSLYIRSRHACIFVATSTQIWKALSVAIRRNATKLYVFRLRNQGDLDSLLDEVSAVGTKKDLLALYRLAVSEPHAFLYIDFMQQPDRMFYINLDRVLQITN